MTQPTGISSSRIPSTSTPETDHLVNADELTDGATVQSRVDRPLVYAPPSYTTEWPLDENGKPISGFGGG